MQASPYCCRSQLPLDAFEAMLAANQKLAERHMERLLQHGHLHCSPLVVAMLRLDLLAGRLPATKQPPLGALTSLLHHR